ncbi:hypothetical protein [Massilioclostridium coli]|uniref:hypothetical protein n=1 Tax=Massilioclostridium coli TaxID=1870991 RepID=UPI001356474D|nr:hypothetical protein [Massilioclostridium coli]
MFQPLRAGWPQQPYICFVTVLPSSCPESLEQFPAVTENRYPFQQKTQPGGIAMGSIR